MTNSSGNISSSLAGARLVVATIKYPPISQKGPDGRWGGFAFDILDELAKARGFTYSVEEQTDMVWGADVGNGTYNGMIGKIARGDADIGVSTFTITEGRHDVVDFSPPVYYDDFTMVMKRPNATGSNYFALPLSGQVWLALAMCVPVLVCLLTLFQVCGDKIHSNRTSRRYDCLSWSKLFYDNTFNVIGIFLAQGLTSTSMRSPARILLGFIWLLAVVVDATYMGNLTAFLTAKRITLPISSLEQVADSSVKLSVLKDSAAESIFSMAKDGPLRDIYERKIKGNEASRQRTMPEQFSRALEDPQVASILPYKAFEYLHMNDPPHNYSKCRFSLIDVSVYFNMAAFPMQKNGPYTKEIAYGIERMHATGIIENIRQRYMGSPSCTGFERTEAHTKFSLDATWGVICVLFGGVILAFVVLLLEIVITKARISCWGRGMLSRDREQTETSASENVSQSKGDSQSHRHSQCQGYSQGQSGSQGQGQSQGQSQSQCQPGSQGQATGPG